MARTWPFDLTLPAFLKDVENLPRRQLATTALGDAGRFGSRLEERAVSQPHLAIDLVRQIAIQQTLTYD